MFSQLLVPPYRIIGALMLVVLAGCQSTNNRTSVGPIAVGPGSNSGAALGEVKKSYKYNSDIYLDVAIPVFNPGFPLHEDGSMDYDAIEEQKIWPQLRNTETKKFAIQVKEHLQNTKAFGSVNVVPSPDTTADLFVLGTILKSNGEVVKVQATVLDSTGAIWGTKEFSETVSAGFFRDFKNENKDPYTRVYKRVADYVYDLVVKQSDDSRRAIKQMTNVRYAQLYSPESYSSFTSSKVVKGRKFDYVKHTLNATPASDDPMMNRIEVIRSHDLMFIDRLQDQYNAFDVKTDEPYREWQSVALPEVIAARDAASERNLKAGIALLATVATAILDKNSNSTAGKVGKYVAGATAVWAGASAMQANDEMKAHKETLDELGEQHDLQLTPTVAEVEEQRVELSGTATEQYQQWKAHLKKIYEIENSSAAL